MPELQYTLKNDALFKVMFVKYPALLRDLVAKLLNLRPESISDFVITNPELTPEKIGGKFCRLDIHMLVDGQRVDIELQVENEGDYPERVLYYWARSYSLALSSGHHYAELPRTVIISIINFPLFDCEEFLSEFAPLEVTRHTRLSDRMGLYFFELRKLPAEISAEDGLKLWQALFKAETEEDLAKLKAMEVPIMSQAVDAFHTITISPEFQELELMRSKALHDEAQALHHARLEGRLEERLETARNALLMNMPIEDIVKLTGFTREEVENLRH